MILRTLVLLCSVLVVNVGWAQERTITVVGDKWCPFNCSDDPGNRGILVERAAAALADANIGIRYLELPWSRAIAEVRAGEIDAIVGAGPEETPDFHFPARPLAIARHSFFTLPSSDWQYTGLESLAQVRLGVIQDYSYGTLFNDYIQPHNNDEQRIVVLRGNDVLPRLVEMLRLSRIDAFVAEERVLAYHFSSKNMPNPLRNAGLASEEHLYIAFSPALGDGVALVSLLSQQLPQLSITSQYD